MPLEIETFSTCVLDVAHAAINRVYAAERPISFTGPVEGFACDLRFATAGSLGGDRVHFATAARAAIAPVDFLLVVAAVRASQQIVAGHEEVQLGPGVVARFPNDATLVARGVFDVVTVRLPLAVVERVAEERLGVPGADVRFDGLLPASERMRRRWLELMRFVHQQLVDPGSTAAVPLVQAHLAELVAATALAVFPNTTMSHDGLPGTGRVAPAVVRRAVAFIDAHASLPITVTDVAHAAGIGPRALQLAFARHLGQPPTAYLRRVRLDGAHRQLQAADPAAGDTVAAIAARWGFAKPDRFTAAYRAAYGKPPSHTLRT